MEQILNLLVRGIGVAVFLFIGIISIISHNTISHGRVAAAKEAIRRAAGKTVGGRVFFYSMMLACLNGFWWGWNSPFLSVFLVMAILSERLITYRICRGDKDFLGRALVKFNW